MPGVPHEMKAMMTNIIIPKLRETFQTPVIEHFHIRTVGIGESFLAEKIADWERSLPPHIKLAYLPSFSQVKLRLTALGSDRETLIRENRELVDKLKPLVGEYIFGYGTDDLEVVVGQLLKTRGLTIATAESCTGGHLSHMITSVPGSSAYFRGGVIAYANEIKISELGVREQTLKEHGAVSEETVSEMAQGIRKRYSTDIGIATSGIAGPDGGTAEKPVGTVWIAYADAEKTVTRKLQLSRDRMVNTRISSILALNLVRLNMPSSG